MAALDAFRDDDAAAPTVDSRLRGEIVWSDRACGRHGVRLPDLARRAFRTTGCGVFTRFDNLGVKDGEVAWFAFAVPGGTTTLLTRDALAAEVGSRFRIRAVAWLRGVRFAALLSGPRELLTIWEGPRMIRVLPPDAGAFDDLRASRSGGFFAVIDTRAGRLLGYDRDGNRIPLPDGRAIAWSPREQWAVVAADGELVVVGSQSGDRIARVDADAVDVDWR